LGWLGFRALFSLGLRKQHMSRLPSVCVGNLTVGGSGKTPTSLFVCDLLSEMGYRPLLMMSGYGGPHYRSPAVAPAGSLRASEWGDEPAMARWLRPSLAIAVGKDRVAAARLAAKHTSCTVMVLDDGFQHLPLIKDISIVLDPPELANRWMMPSGPYREPRGAGRKRADLVLPGKFEVSPLPLRFVDGAGNAHAAPRRASVICSVARPHRFREALESAGVEVEPALAYPDHDPLTDPDLWDEIPSGQPVVVTAKDWVKLRERADAGSYKILIALRESQIAPRDAFRQWLGQRLREASQAREKGLR
jgi:tetraacyldisaccharide 4'-kinase